jgi:hypothetical protein
VRVHVMHELIGFGIAADVVGRVAAGDHDAVEIFRRKCVVATVAFGG